MVLRELQKSGRKVFQVHSPDDFTEVTKIYSKPIIMIDDILGDIEFDHAAWLKWKCVFYDVFDMTATTDKTEVIILLVGRDVVLNEGAGHMAKLYNYIVPDLHIVDMSHSVKRCFDEKQNIWDAIVGPSGINLPQALVKKIFHTESGHGFPHACRLFVTLYKEMPNLSPESFFQKPLAFLSENIKRLLENNNTLTLFKQMVKNQGKISELVPEAKELVGTYLRIEGGCFVFDHSSIYDIVAFNLCKLHTLFIIENCSLSFIHQRLRLDLSLNCNDQSISKNETDLAVHISQSFAVDLAKRFAAEIQKGNLQKIISHQACTQETFIKQMMSYICIPLWEIIKLKDSENLSAPCFLFLSASSGSPHLLKYIDKNIQLTQTEIKTVLLGVCEYAAIDVLKYLRQTRPTFDINMICKDEDQTPIMLFAEKRNSELVSQILSLDPDLSVCDCNGYTVLHYMCEYGHVAAAKQLIDRGIDIDTGTDIKKVSLADMLPVSPLTMACEHNQVEVVKLLLSRGAKIEWNAFENACICGSSSSLKLLLKSNASPDRVPIDLNDFLYRMCVNGEINIDEDTIRSLVKAGASVNICDGKTSLLHMACRSDQPQVVNCLVKLGADLHSKDSDGSTPLHTTAVQRFYKCVDVLLKAGAKVNVQRDDGKTPLHTALWDSDSVGQTVLPNMSICQTLIRQGADVNQPDRDGNSPLHLLCHVDRETRVVANLFVYPATFYQEEFRGLVQLLMDNGADANIRNNRRETALHGWPKYLFKTKKACTI